MKAELNRLESVDKDFENKINLRKKQFHLFLVALRDLQKLVECEFGLLLNCLF